MSGTDNGRLLRELFSFVGLFQGELMEAECRTLHLRRRDMRNQPSLKYSITWMSLSLNLGPS